MTTTRTRSAAVICVLSAGLFIGSAGGAIAAADSDGGGATSSPGQSTTGTGSSGPATGVATALKDAVQKPLDALAGTVETIKSAGQLPDAVVKSKKELEAEAAEAESGIESALAAAADADDADDAAATPDETAVDAAEPLTAVVTVPDVAPPTTVATPEPVAAPVVLPSATDPAKPTPATGGSGKPSTHAVPPVAQAVTKVTDSVGDVVTTVGSAVNSVTTTVLSLPKSQTPITDLITAVQNALTSVNDSIIPLTYLPTDIATMLGFPLDTGVPVDVAEVKPTADIAVPPIAALLAPLPEQLPDTALSGPAPLAPEETGTDIAGLAGLLPVAMSHQLAPEPALPAITPAPAPHKSFLERAATKLLVPISLWALATAALPGLGGLLIISAAGVRLGYRQAKAGIAMRASGIARFAGPGPLGVVRSGSMIALHSRKARVATPPNLKAARFLEQVA